MNRMAKPVPWLPKICELFHPNFILMQTVHLNKSFLRGVRICLLTFSCAFASSLPGSAAVYYVAKGGSDKATGTASSPWLTVSRAATTLIPGDTVLVGPGDYDEHVFQYTAGTAAKPVTYRASQPGKASIRAFRFGAPFLVLDGFNVTRYSGARNLWGAAVRIDANAHQCIVTNCQILDSPSAIAQDFRFDSKENRISSATSDFTKAGFVPGSLVYLGAAGLDGLWFTNHDTRWTVSRVSPTSMWVTNSAGSSFLPDTGSNYWAVVRPGSVTGFQAISFVISGGIGASNVVITGNTISNWMGHAISLAGRANRLESNRVTRLHSFRFLSFEGSDHIIRGNIIKDSPNILHFSSDEIGNLPRPAGTGWYDYQVGMLSGYSLNDMISRTNVLIEGNWFENLENQMGRLDDEQPSTYGITFARNVFIGITAHFSGGRDGMRWISNTFFRCAHDSSVVLALGGRAPAQTGYVITKNLFIDSGSRIKLNDRGWYGFSTNATLPYGDYNMVAGPEINGYNPKDSFVEPNGINGGDPLFLNAFDPLGPDGRPFTADDGLQVLPNSPAARIGGGACGIFLPNRNQPVAHFRVSKPNGWFEATGTNYNPTWLRLLPTTRRAVQRPYNTPASLGTVPVSVTFDASSSISGVNSDNSNTDIIAYRWTFGDGTTEETSSPVVTHVFNKPGDRFIQLTVKNRPGSSHSVSNIYRFLDLTGTASNAEVPAPRGKPAPPLGLRALP